MKEIREYWKQNLSFSSLSSSYRAFLSTVQSNCWGCGGREQERLLPYKEKTMLGFALLLFAVAIPQMQALLIEPESVRV